MRHSNADWLPLLLERLEVVRGPNARGDYTAWCPIHRDGQGKPPHNPNLNVSERGWYCHVCKKGGNFKQLAEEMGIEMPSQRRSKSRSRVQTWYDYRDEQGQLLFQVGRKVPKDFTQRRPGDSGGWVWSLNGTRRVVYRLPELVARSDETVWIAEGEKDVDRLHELGLLATTNSGGADEWRTEHSESLRDRDVAILPDNDDPGRDVAILPDNDDPGRKHTVSVAKSLDGIARSVKVIPLPGLAEKGDVSDWLAAGHTKEELEELLQSVPPWDGAGDALPKLSPTDERPTPRTSRAQADVLLDLAQERGIELFKDTRGEPLCFIPVNGHREAWPCADRHVKAWLTRQFMASEDRVPNLTALNTAINSLDAQARLGSQVIEVHNRVATVTEDEIWIDLSDEDWRAIQLTPEGWEIVATPPVAFRRYNHQLPQVEPIRGGSLEDLIRFVNVRDGHNQLLLQVYLVSAFIPNIPHPVCVLYGPQGSSKSTLSRILRKLIDPSLTPTLALPHEPDRLVQTLDHHWVAAFDNVSGYPRWASDAFCRAVTGDGLSKRALYTNDDDFIFAFRRCVVLNGINVSAVQPDLLDRALLIGLDPITARQRLTEEELWKQFEAIRPQLLGAALDVLSKAMLLKPGIFTSNLPRMADFAHWGIAIAEALGHKSDEFLDAYDANVSRQNEEAVNAHPVATVLIQYVTRRERWEGSPSDLLKELTDEAAGRRIDTRHKLWPKQPNHLTKVLNELAPNLLASGVSIDTGRSGRLGRQIVVSQIPILSQDNLAGAEPQEGLGL